MRLSIVLLFIFLVKVTTGQTLNAVSSSQSTDENCWSIIHSGEDIYNGQIFFQQSPGNYAPEITSINKANEGFFTTGHFNNVTFDSRNGDQFTDLNEDNGSYLTKHDGSGKLQWIVYTKKHETSERDITFFAKEDLEGNIYLGGHSRGIFYDNFGNTIDFGKNEIAQEGFVIKLNDQGKIIWHLKGTNIYSKRIDIDSNNNILITGDVANSQYGHDLYLDDTLLSSLDLFESVDVNRFIMKLGKDGSLKWYTGLKTRGPNSQFLDDVNVDSNNNTYVTGHCSDDFDLYSASDTTVESVFVRTPYPQLFHIKYDENGQILWKVTSKTERPSGIFGVRPLSTAVDADGNSYISGTNDVYNEGDNQVFINSDATSYSSSVGQFFVAKISPAGICEWINGGKYSYFGYGHKTIIKDNEIITLSTIGKFRQDIATIDLTSSDDNQLEFTSRVDDYFFTVYDKNGKLKRVFTSGINSSGNGLNDNRMFHTVAFSGFFADREGSFYVSRALGFFDGLTTPFQNFSHDLNPLVFDGIDAVVTKFNEKCGDVFYNLVNLNVPELQVCDNESVGSDTDGKIQIDLTIRESDVVNDLNSSDYTFKYFKDDLYSDRIFNPSSYQNITRSENIYIEVTDDANPNFNGRTSFALIVRELPDVNDTIVLEQCDDDQDGFSVFNLEESKEEISNNASNEVFTFYNSLADAELRINPITDPTDYTNQTVSSDLVFVRVENQAGCYRTAEIQLTVTTTQIPDSFIREFYACDDGADITDGIATFDFSSVVPEIENQFPSGQQLVIRFYRNENDALRELNAITDVSNYQNAGYRDQQEIYVRVDSEIDNDCLGLGHHITLNVTGQPELVTITLPEQCDTDGDGLFSFDTSTIESQLTGNDAAFSITYTDQSGATLSSPLPNPFVTSSQTLTARVETNAIAGNTTTCFVEIPLEFNVRTPPQAQPVDDLRVCDSDQDGLYEFDLTPIEQGIINGQAGAEIRYFRTDGSEITLTADKTFISTGERITARLSSSEENSCFTETSFNLIVDQQPVANAVDAVFLCLDPSVPLTNDFDLAEFDAIILGTQPAAVFTIEYFESAADAMARVNPITTAYTVNNGNTEVFARISNVNNERCYEVTSFSLGVYRMPVANLPGELEACENENGGPVTVDLNVQTDAVLNGQSQVDVIVSYHLSLTDAEAGINEIASGLLETDQSIEVFVRTENFLLEDCHDTTSFQVELVARPILDLENEYPLCNNLNSLEIELDGTYDRIEWSTGATTNQVSITEPGIYSVTVYNEYDTVICETFREFTVVPSIVPEIERIDVQDFSQNSNSIEVVLSSQGSFEYSIDGFSFQRSNVFEGLDAGTYEVTVRDISGCGISTETVIILDYPRFFTPNGDGFNDTWHIENAVSDPASQVFIFDRYGKLLGSLSAADQGWNGTFNGEPLPSSDYWFEFKMSDGRSFKGHFSLKR